jgi:tetratricopeptide (TPR) repeat protein
MKKLFLFVFTIFLAYYSAFITSGASKKQGLFEFGNSLAFYKFMCALTGETDTTDAKQLFYRGDMYFSQEQYELAVRDMQKALMLDSSFYYAHLFISKALLMLEDTTGAIQNAKLYIKKSYEPSEGYLELGHILKSQGMKDSSLYYYQKAYQANNNLSEAIYQIALNYYHSDLLYEALDYIFKAIELNNYDPGYRNLRRLIYLKQGKFELAREDYEFITLNHSGYFANYKEKGDEEKEKGNFQAAVEYYKLALEDMSYNREILEAKAWIYLSLKKYDSALIDYQKIVENEPDYLSFSNVAYTLDLLNRVQESIENYNKSIELKNDHYLSYINRGYEYHRLRNYIKAEEDYSMSIMLKGDYYLPYYNRGLLYYELKQYQKAINDYHQAIKYAENPKDIIYSLALAYDELKNTSEAIHHYNEYLKLAGEDDSVNINSATNRINQLNK